MTFTATVCGSFGDASEALWEVGELSISEPRVRRAAERIGDELSAEAAAAVARFEALPLPAQQGSPMAVTPRVVCVQMDGGRLQVRDRHAPERNDEGTYWREMKAGVLLTLESQVQLTDPCPQLPESFADPGKIRKMAREIKGFCSGDAVEEAPSASDEASPDDRPGRPQPLVKSVVATRGDVYQFGPRLAAAAYERGFHAAPRKAFVADGSEANWGVWRRHFSHYTPILDFTHALMYVYAAAMAGGSAHEGWTRYRDWAQWLWSGEIDRLLAAFAARQAELGAPAADETGTARSEVAQALTYVQHQRTRMNYPEYRRQGLPLTSSYIESTVKQINRRMKGSEKFWSEGAESMLQLVAAHLSETQPLEKFWAARARRLASYQLAS